MDESPRKKKPAFTARNKLMDYLARRDHSVKELRQKLSTHFTGEEIDQALEYAKEHNWLLPPDELAEKVANRLHEKLKGRLFIDNYLREKGLPSVAFDDELEYEKAIEFIDKKARHQELDRDKKGRILKNRGFDISTIQRVLNATS